MKSSLFTRVGIIGVSLGDVYRALICSKTGCVDPCDDSVVLFELAQPVVETFPPDVDVSSFSHYEGFGPDVLAVSVVGVKKTFRQETGKECWSVEGYALICLGVVWHVIVRSTLSKNSSDIGEIQWCEQCHGGSWSLSQC